MINSSPLFGQHKSFIDYAIFLVRRWIIPYLSKKSVKEVHVVFDHPERQGVSPKQIERLRRDEQSSSNISNHIEINDSSELPADWRSFLADRKSKRSLINYLSDTFLSLVPKFLNDTKSFTIASGFDFEQRDKAFTCTHSEKYENVPLKSDHEEADSRVCFHALKCEHRNILIFSPDTDTVHTGLPLVDQRNDKEVVIQLSDKLGHQSFVYINKLIKCLKSDPDLGQVTNDSVCSIIQFLFIVSGCDYISFFAGFGKIRFLQTFFQYATFISPNSALLLGRLDAKTDGLLAFLRLIGCLYYKKHTSAFSDKSPASFLKTFSGKDVLDTHIQWLTSIRETVWGQCNEDEKDYLPSFEAVRFHWSRACWVSSLWMQADQATVEYLPVDDYGWVIESGVLTIQWDSPENIAHITDVVKQLTSGCSCKKAVKPKGANVIKHIVTAV